MSTCVNTLKRLLLILIGVAVATYVVSLNMEKHFVICHSKWISNDFVFATVCGIFASLFVVIVCECIKYRQMKKSVENAIFMYYGNLYGQFLIIRGNCQRAINGNEVVADNLIQSTSDNAMALTDSIRGLDYKVFHKNSKIENLLNHFRLEKHLSIKNVLVEFTFLRVAIREDSKQLMLAGKRDIVTANCPKVNETLHRIADQSEIIIAYLDQQLSQIDDEFKNRYNWDSIKKTLNDYQTNYTGQLLDNYLQKELVTF